MGVSAESITVEISVNGAMTDANKVAGNGKARHNLFALRSKFRDLSIQRKLNIDLFKVVTISTYFLSEFLEEPFLNGP